MRFPTSEGRNGDVSGRLRRASPTSEACDGGSSSSEGSLYVVEPPKDRRQAAQCRQTLARCGVYLGAHEGIICAAVQCRQAPAMRASTSEHMKANAGSQTDIEKMRKSFKKFMKRAIEEYDEAMAQRYEASALCNQALKEKEDMAKELVKAEEKNSALADALAKAEKKKKNTLKRALEEARKKLANK